MVQGIEHRPGESKIDRSLVSHPHQGRIDLTIDHCPTHQHTASTWRLKRLRNCNRLTEIEAKRLETVEKTAFDYV